MGTYKRPLADGEICQDSRVAYNPFLGQCADEKKAEPEVVTQKASKKKEVAVEPASETVEPEAEAAE